MQITEIYKSLQGESTYAGLPCVFVRLTGCNLRCSWCDTEYSFFGGEKMSPEQVLKEIADLSLPGGLVEITGGEPMLQERELVPLMLRLLDSGYRVLLETSGERELDRVPPAFSRWRCSAYRPYRRNECVASLRTLSQRNPAHAGNRPTYRRRRYRKVNVYSALPA